jgi:hypothetical protein
VNRATYWRQRNDLVRAAGRHIQPMQKAMTQMIVQLANVLSDVSGMTGQAVIKAILAGERDSHQLAAFRDWLVKASAEEIACSLEPTTRRLAGVVTLGMVQRSATELTCGFSRHT